MLDAWFPTTIYYEDIIPEKEDYENMLKYAYNFIEKNQDAFSNNLTGDVFGDYCIHNNNVFRWLNSQVSIHCKKYLQLLGVDISKINIYSQKSWIVSCSEETGKINSHTHKNSVLSAVYYLVSKADNSKLEFISDNKIFNLPIVFDKPNSFSFNSCLYEPILNRLLIFPSNIIHQVENNVSNRERISVTYDIMITSKGIDNNIEHMILDPSLWKKL